MYLQLLPPEMFLYIHRASLPDSSETARAIASGAAWLTIASCAVQEGYLALADGLVSSYEQMVRQAG